MVEDFIGLVLGERYELQALLGSGGVAMVFVAYDRTLDRQVAVKIVKPELILSGEIPDIADRFVKEARIVASLEDPRILRVYDQGKQLVEGYPLVYLVMQLASGGTLADLIRQEGALTPFGAERILQQVCLALDYAHEHRVIHLDLKPANILLDESGNALVADFGVARLFHTTTYVTTQSVAGTPPYMPLEQLLGKHAGRPSDVYALGITLYQALTGELPERELTEKGLLVHLSQPLLPGIRAVIERATHPDPSRRYQTAGELAQAFTAALHPPPPGPHPAPWRPWALRIGITLAALIAIVGLAVFGSQQSWWNRVIEAVWAAVSSTPTASPTVAATPTATLQPSPVPAPSATFTPTASPTPTPVLYALARVQQSYVYAGPGENYNVLGTVRRGDRLPIYGRSRDNTWLQVDYLGGQVWMPVQAVEVPVAPTVLPTVVPPPTPTKTPRPTATPVPTPNPEVPLQNPRFEGIQANFIPGWVVDPEDSYSDNKCSSEPCFDTPFVSETHDPARMIDGPTLQAEATAYVNFKVYILQTVSVPPAVPVRFEVWAKAYSDSVGVQLAAGIEPNGHPDCSQARWGSVLLVDQSRDPLPVWLVAPTVAAGQNGRVTVCLYAESVYPVRSNAAFFDNAKLVANPQ